MDPYNDKARLALLELPEEAVSYLLPPLHSRDIQRLLGLETTSYSISMDCQPEPKPESGSGARYSFGKQSSPVTAKELSEEEEDEALIREDDERGQRIQAALARVLEEYHVTAAELRQYIDFAPLSSHLRITRSGQILLTDFADREVKMDTLSKVVYILFLRHPEGIVFKELGNYKAEMMRIYGRLTHRLDYFEMEKSIDRLCNTVEQNSINEKVSRVKRAFLNAVEEDIASYYYIKGPAGGIRKIELRRDLVSIHLLL